MNDGGSTSGDGCGLQSTVPHSTSNQSVFLLSSSRVCDLYQYCTIISNILDISIILYSLSYQYCTIISIVLYTLYQFLSRLDYRIFPPSSIMTIFSNPSTFPKTEKGSMMDIACMYIISRSHAQHGYSHLVTHHSISNPLRVQISTKAHGLRYTGSLDESVLIQQQQFCKQDLYTNVSPPVSPCILT